jgi:hypothetical protein
MLNSNERGIPFMLRKTRLIAVITCLFCAYQLTSTATEDPPGEIDGYWEGFVERQGAKLEIKVEFKNAADGIKAVIDIPDLYIHSYKLTNIRIEQPGVHFELPFGRETDKFDGVFKGEFIEGTYSGRFYQAEVRTANLIIWRSKKKPLPYKEEEIGFQNGDVRLAPAELTLLSKKRETRTTRSRPGNDGKYWERRHLACLSSRAG